MTRPDTAAIEERLAKITPWPWFWNTYSCVFSSPMTHLSNELELLHEKAGEPWGPDGNYPHAWKEIDKALNSVVTWVPPSHGDTATGRHAADAIFIEHSPADVRALLDYIAELERAAWNPA